MSRQNYIKPVLCLSEVQTKVILCTSIGVDPSGKGEDFVWGNSGSGTNPGGTGDNFNWGN